MATDAVVYRQLCANANVKWYPWDRQELDKMLLESLPYCVSMQSCILQLCCATWWCWNTPEQRKKSVIDSYFTWMVWPESTFTCGEVSKARKKPPPLLSEDLQTLGKIESGPWGQLPLALGLVPLSKFCLVTSSSVHKIYFYISHKCWSFVLWTQLADIINGGYDSSQDWLTSACNSLNVAFHIWEGQLLLWVSPTLSARWLQEVRLVQEMSGVLPG